MSDRGQRQGVRAQKEDRKGETGGTSPAHFPEVRNAVEGTGQNRKLPEG